MLKLFKKKKKYAFKIYDLIENINNKYYIQ